MKLVRELKEFAMRGNVVDMAVGIIIGSSFGRIVSSLVSDIIMPPIGFLIGGVNFSRLSITLKEATEQAPAVVIGYGKFLQTIVDFAIIVSVIFFVIKALNSFRRRQEERVADSSAPSTQEVLLTEIRDLLKGDKSK